MSNPFTAVMADHVDEMLISDPINAQNAVAALELELEDALPCEDSSIITHEICKAKYRRMDLGFLKQTREDCFPLFAAFSLASPVGAPQPFTHLEVSSHAHVRQLKEDKIEAANIDLTSRVYIGRYDEDINEFGDKTYNSSQEYNTGLVPSYWPSVTWDMLKAHWHQTYDGSITERVKVYKRPSANSYEGREVRVEEKVFIKANFPKLTIPAKTRQNIRSAIDLGLYPILITEAPEWEIGAEVIITNPDPLVIASHNDQWFLIDYFDLTPAEEIAFREWRE